MSNKSKIIKAGTLDPAISDHKMIYAIVNIINKTEHPIIKTVKNYKYVDKSKFKSALQNVPWWVYVKAELMNNYFATVGEKLAEGFPAQIESEHAVYIENNSKY